MSQDTKNVLAKKDECKYDASWKQNVQLSEDEEDQQQIILVSSGEEDNDQQDNPQDNETLQKGSPLPTSLSKEEIDINKLEPLVFLDEPGLFMYVSQDPDISQLLQIFFPKALFELFNQNINQTLQQIIKKDHASDSQLQTMFQKKRFGDAEVGQYLGLSIWFGIFRFPTISHYWHSENYMKGGIEICMQEGRYRFIENNMMIFADQQEQQKALHLTQEVRKKWKKIYKPDQELILYKLISPAYTVYYLIDSETLFILDEVVIFNEMHLDKVQQILLHFADKNIIVYFSKDSLDIKLIMLLVENNIYPVGEISIESLRKDEETLQFLELLQEEYQTYCTDKLCFTKSKDIVLVFPKRKVRLEGSFNSRVEERFQQELEQLITKASDRIIQINLYKSPFTYQANINYQQHHLDLENQPPLQNLNYLSILFEEFFEGTIYNMFTFFNSILINNQSKCSFKQFKLNVAGTLVGEKYYQLEKDRKEIVRRATLRTVDFPIQTEKLSFGLPREYDQEVYHIPILEERVAQVKYCVVCMKYENLSKSYYRCLQCQKCLGQRIFLCVFPCFELFHRNPTQFIECDPRLINKFKDDKYYKVEDMVGKEKLDLEYQSVVYLIYYYLIQKKNLDKLPTLIPESISQVASKQQISEILGKEPPKQTPQRRQPPKQTQNNNNGASSTGVKGNAKNAPQHYNWSYNRGFRRKGDEDDPIERDFEDLINTSHQQSLELLTRPQTMSNKSAANLHTPNAKPRAQPQQIKPQEQVYQTPQKPIQQEVPKQIIHEPKSQIKERKLAEKSVPLKSNDEPPKPVSRPVHHQPEQQEEQVFKSPFEKFMEQVKKKNQGEKSSKLEEEQQ